MTSTQGVQKMSIFFNKKDFFIKEIVRDWNDMWDNKCYVSVGKKFLTFTKHMSFPKSSSDLPYHFNLTRDITPFFRALL